MKNNNITDLITQINNGVQANKDLLIVEWNKENYQFINELTRLGILDIELSNNKLVIKLNQQVPKLKIISKPGKRIYRGYKKFRGENKTIIIRTSKGIISSNKAIKNKIGGELLVKY